MRRSYRPASARQGWRWKTPLPFQKLAKALGGLLPTGFDYKLGLSLGQNIYTPTDTDTTAALPNDRPYAAWLYGSSAFQIYRAPETSASGWGAAGRLDIIEV